MIQNYSLRHRLIAWISLPVLLAGTLTFLIGFAFVWHEIEEVYDAQMVHSAKVLLQLTQHEIMEDEGFHLGVEDPDLHHKYERKLGFRIWVDNSLITQSPSTESFAQFEAPPGFSDQTIDKHDWRFFVFINPANKIKIEVSERYDIRYELITQLMSALIAPALIFIPIIFLLVWIGVRKVLQPVVKMSADVDKRNSDDLAPIGQSSLPKEIAPLVQAINRLFVRIGESFQREREFTDHAAHELRTPLAAMKTQTQVLLKKAGNIPECREGLENLEASINRATHLVSQLLSLARLQNEKFPMTQLDLSVLLQNKIKDMEILIAEKSIALRSDIAPDVLISGNAGSLPILLGDLLDNAVKYTPSGGSVHVSLSSSGLMQITDSGPGLSDADKLRVFERFVRADKSGQTGSGLGLSIANWIAHAHGVTIQLNDNEPHGLIARIQWKVIG